METIFQSIEILSKEKGIDPQIVLDAVKDAMLIAARKHYRTNEDYVADMDPKTGAIQLYAVKKVVEAVEDPVHEVTVSEARRIMPGIEVGGELRIQKNTEALGRISAQTARWSLPGMKCTEYLSTAQLRSTRTWSRVSRAFLPGGPQVGLSALPAWTAASA